MQSMSGGSVSVLHFAEANISINNAGRNPDGESERGEGPSGSICGAKVNREREGREPERDLL